MTEKLFYSDPYISSVECTVTEIYADGANTVIVLAATPFFPEGGGQQCDKGTIGGFEILSVTEENGKVLHTVKGNAVFAAGDKVLCLPDAKKRFERMQAHTGEHIFSGIAYKLYGVNNVGFHMDDTVMTVDFDKFLTREQISQIEDRANSAVWENLPVISGIYSPEEQKKIDFRSKKEFPGDVRLVTIPGVDCCACCAPHLTHTGETGLILVLSAVSHRGGVRLTLVCGKTAFEIAKKRYSQVKSIAGALTVPQDEAVEGFEAFTKKTDEIRLEKNRLEERLCETAVRGIEIKERFNAAVVGLNASELNTAAAVIYEKADYPVVLLSDNGNSGFNYIITAKNYPLKERIREINTALNGRGGGKNEAVRGVFNSEAQKIIKYFEELPL